MQPVLVDDRLDLGQVGDLMDQGRRVLAVQRRGRNAGRNRACSHGTPEFLGRDQRAERLGMSGLSAAVSSGGRSGWLSLQADRIGGGRLGRVGGVELSRASRLVIRCSNSAIRPW